MWARFSQTSVSSPLQGVIAFLLGSQSETLLERKREAHGHLYREGKQILEDEIEEWDSWVKVLLYVNRQPSYTLYTGFCLVQSQGAYVQDTLAC
jgi:hypothetical protein